MIFLYHFLKKNMINSQELTQMTTRDDFFNLIKLKLDTFKNMDVNVMIDKNMTDFSDKYGNNESPNGSCKAIYCKSSNYSSYSSSPDSFLNYPPHNSSNNSPNNSSNNSPRHLLNSSNHLLNSSSHSSNNSSSHSSNNSSNNSPRHLLNSSSHSSNNSSNNSPRHLLNSSSHSSNNSSGYSSSSSSHNKDVNFKNLFNYNDADNGNEINFLYDLLSIILSLYFIILFF